MLFCRSQNPNPDGANSELPLPSPPHRMDKARKGTKPRWSWAPGPISVVDLRFEASPFLFINILARIRYPFYFQRHPGKPKIDISSTFVFNNIVILGFIFQFPFFLCLRPSRGTFPAPFTIPIWLC
jgi:hypothetical protein